MKLTRKPALLLDNQTTFLSCNGNELASFYDQNHDRFELNLKIFFTKCRKKKTLIEIVDSNHKNSMAGQSIVAELAEGDRVQVGIRMILSETLGMMMAFVFCRFTC